MKHITLYSHSAPREYVKLHMPQEIPPAFTEKTGWPLSTNCAFVTGIAGTRAWPIEFHISQDGSGKRKAKVVGHGWSDFLRTEEVQPGSFLIFEVLDARCLKVTVYHPTSPRKPAVAGEEGPVRRESHGPVFVKKLRATHLRPGSASRLVKSSNSIEFFLPFQVLTFAFLFI